MHLIRSGRGAGPLLGTTIRAGSTLRDESCPSGHRPTGREPNGHHSSEMVRDSGRRRRVCSRAAHLRVWGVDPDFVGGRRCYPATQPAYSSTELPTRLWPVNMVWGRAVRPVRGPPAAIRANASSGRVWTTAHHAVAGSIEMLDLGGAARKEKQVPAVPIPERDQSSPDTCGNPRWCWGTSGEAVSSGIAGERTRPSCALCRGWTASSAQSTAVRRRFPGIAARW